MAFKVLEGALVMRRGIFDAIGGWPGSFWYAHEGIDIAWRVWDAGYVVRYAGDLVAEHPLTAVTRHNEYYRLSGRNRVWVARRNLPWLFGVPYVLSWTALQVVRSRREPEALLTYLRGTWEGIRTPVERRPLRWRTIARMTRYGRPPVW